MNLFLEKIKGDKIIWSIVILLAVFSFLPVYSASSNFGNSFVLSNVLKHLAIVTVGILIMYGTHLIPYKYFKGLSKLALPFIIAVLILTSLQGNLIDGANASRWIKLPIIGLSFQPSSMAIVVLMVYVSFYLSNKYFPIPYNYYRILMYFFLMIFIYLIIYYTNFSPILDILFLVGYCLLVYALEKPKMTDNKTPKLF